jgi:hypothetical protein
MRSCAVPAAASVAVVLCAAGGLAQAPDAAVAAACRPQQLRLYVYTSPAVRPRHAEVVRRALERRAEVHSSGFAEEDGAPRLALGPVRERVFHWRWRDGVWDRNTSMPVAWPFVAVLEYDGRGQPRAWIDWFRRPKGSRDGGAWTKDPADQRYARHIGDAYATAHDQRFAYLAIVDTPTGGVVFGNEWVVRARVQWGDEADRVRGGNERGDPDGVQQRAGIHIWFERRGADVDDWAAVQNPLVGWVPRPGPGRRGDASGSSPVERPFEQLAVIGTTTVFTLPPIPDDVPPARGFPEAAPGSLGGAGRSVGDGAASGRDGYSRTQAAKR